MNINFLLNPKKTIKFDEIEVTIEGCNPDVEQYVEELLYRKTNSDDARSELSRRYIKRLICCSIKDVKNLPLKVASFILLSTYCIFMVLFPLDTIILTVIFCICVSVGVVLNAILDYLSKR